MTPDKTRAIAASAYNVCGPQTGEPARPATVGKFGHTRVLQCVAEYSRTHDESLYTKGEIIAAYDLLAA